MSKVVGFTGPGGYKDYLRIRKEVKKTVSNMKNGAWDCRFAMQDVDTYEELLLDKIAIEFF